MKYQLQKAKMAFLLMTFKGHNAIIFLLLICKFCMCLFSFLYECLCVCVFVCVCILLLFCLLGGAYFFAFVCLIVYFGEREWFSLSWLAWNSQRSICLHFPSVELKGVHHYSGPLHIFCWTTLYCVLSFYMPAWLSYPITSKSWVCCEGIFRCN